MKTRYAISMLVFGYCLHFIGAVLKITHHPFADMVFYAAMVLKVAGALLFLYKLLTYPRFRDFLDH
jgi:hypothetical protein